MVEAPTQAPAKEAPPGGTGVGDLAPAFALNLVDGRSITSAELMEKERPAFLFFHATY